MAIEITIPGFGKGKTTKDLVISLLVDEYPLNAKQITNKIKNKFGVSVTFQGVYKAINQLINNDVLVKDGKNIQISKNWITNAKSFIDSLQRKYFEETKAVSKSAIGEDIQVYYFDNIIALDKFWNNILEAWFKDSTLKDEYLTQQSGHTWYVLGQLEEETAILNSIKEKNLKFYILSDGNTFLDKWSGRYYKSQKFFYATNKSRKKRPKNHYFIIYGDYIMESVYPDDLTTELDTIYDNVKEITDLNLNELIKVLRKKTQLKITIMKNSVLAKRLRKDILKHF